MGLQPVDRRAYLVARQRYLSGKLPERNDPTGVQVWMNAFQMSAEEDISAFDALSLVVRRRAARVRWCDSIVEEIMDEHRRKCEESGKGNPAIPPAAARTWLSDSRQEEMLLARAAKLAIDAGVAGAYVRKMELEGKILSEALIAGLDSLPLTHDQRIEALSVMHRRLLPASRGERPDNDLSLHPIIESEPVDESDEPANDDHDDS